VAPLCGCCACLWHRPRSAKLLTALSSLLPHLPRAEGLPEGKRCPPPPAASTTRSTPCQPRVCQSSLCRSAPRKPRRQPHWARQNRTQALAQVLAQQGEGGLGCLGCTPLRAPWGPLAGEGLGLGSHMWTPAEDALLCTLALRYGPNWALVADALSLCARTGTPPTLDLNAVPPALLQTHKEPPGLLQTHKEPPGSAADSQGAPRLFLRKGRA